MTGFDAAGTRIGTDRTAADGTFALETPERPAQLLVEADHAAALRVAAPAAQTPAIVTVRHARAFDAVPSPADIAALPAGLLPDLASVVPERIAYPSAISDRYLGRGIGVVTIDGMPFYRRADGSDASDLLAAHATGALDVRGPLDAPWYGDRGGGGTIDAQTFDGADALRAGNRDLAARAGNDVVATAARSWDADGTRTLAGVRASLARGPVATTLTMLAGQAPSASYAGIDAAFAAATPLRDVRADVALTRDDGGGTAENARGNVTQMIVDTSGRSANALAVRLRFRAEGGALDTSFLHDDAGLVVGTERGSTVRVRAAVAFVDESERGAYGARNQSSAAILPTLLVDAPLGPSWSVQAGTADATLGTPGIAVARASLAQASLRFDDRRRLRAELVAYAQGAAAPQSLARGFGASLGWEIAPRVSLRAFAVSTGMTVETLLPLYAGGPGVYSTFASAVRRQVAWCTWDGAVRVDALVRDGRVEGAVRAPLDGRLSLVLGSYRPLGGPRVFAVGLAQR